MNISQEISTDIIKYLQRKKGFSVNDIAKLMSTSPAHIHEIINKKTHLNSNDVKSYLKAQNIRFWELASEAIPMNHLPSQTKKKILVCKELTKYIKKKLDNK